jgi:Fungal cellulose binding domain
VYGQCGGKGWKEPTCCQGASTCVPDACSGVVNEDRSYCVPPPPDVPVTGVRSESCLWLRAASPRQAAHLHCVHVSHLCTPSLYAESSAPASTYIYALPGNESHLSMQLQPEADHCAWMQTPLTSTRPR